MNNKYLIELLRQIKEVNNINNRHIKIEKIHHISAYGAYLYYTGLINSFEFTNAITCIKNDLEEISYQEESDIYINYLLDDNLLLNDLFRKHLMIYWKYRISQEESEINIDIENEFNEFLKYMNCYELYNNINKKNNISYNSKILKHSACLDDRDNSYIIIVNKNKFYEYLDLSHEIAHAYENKVLSKYKRYFESPYNVEILSITFNRIFIEYLHENGKISYNDYVSILSDFETNYYYFIKSSLFISDSIIEGYYDIKDYDISIYHEENIINKSLTDYNYAIGRICAFKLLDDWQKDDILFIRNIPNLINEIYHMNISDIVKSYGNNSEIINNELNKVFKKK